MFYKLRLLLSQHARSHVLRPTVIKMNKKIFTVSERKKFRQFNRKRKLEAFFNVAVANDKQREEKKTYSSAPPPSKKAKKMGTRGNKDIIKKEISEIMKKTNNNSLEETKPKLSEEEYAKLKQTLRDRKKFLKGQPRFWLREGGKSASFDLSPSLRIPLLLGDVQQLVLFGLIGNHIFQDHSRWCHLDHHGKVSQVVVMILEGIGYGELLEKTKSKKKLECKGFSDFFPNGVELVGSDAYNRSVVDDFSLVPLSSRSCRSIFLQYGSKEAEMKSKMFRTAFPVGVVKSTVAIEVPVTKEEKLAEKKAKKAVAPAPVPEPAAPKLPLLHPADNFSRLELVMSPSQLMEERYPLPLGEMAFKYGHFVLTKEKYAELTPLSPMFGIDCEMCMTTARLNELTRVSIVNEKYELVYETLVMPYNRITNYLTQYSGITRQMMNGVRTTIKDVQNDIRRLLPPDAILVGQSLNSDLNALQMFHPYCIDSSVIFNINGERKRKTKLKTLFELFMGGKIQDGFGHDSVEDAASALKLVQFKLTKYLEFGDAVLGFDLEKYQKGQLGEVKAAVKLKAFKEAIKKDEAEEKEKEEDKVTYKTVDVNVPQPEALKIMEASSLFNIAAKKKKVGVFCTPDVIDLYEMYLDEPRSKSTEVVKKGSRGYPLESNYEVVKNMCQEVVKFDFAHAHLKLDMTLEKARVRAVNSCLKVANSVKDNSLMIVIASGRGSELKPEYRPGCFIGIKVQPYQQL